MNIETQKPSSSEKQLEISNLLECGPRNLPGADNDFESDATRRVFGTTPVSKKR